MKYSVMLEYWKSVEIEADNEEDAIRKATIKVTNNPNDFFTSEEEIADMLSDIFVENHWAEVLESEEA